MNDEDEFKFQLDYKPSPRTFHLLAKALIQYRTTNYCPPYISAYLTLESGKLECIAAPIIADVVNKCRTTIGITSFSIAKTDVRLWKEYGGKGNGVCVEINIPDKLVGESYHRVHYASNKIFCVDSFFESALCPDKAFETYRNILLPKTKKWEEEQEMRFIGNRQDVNLIFAGHISEVTFGPNVPTHTLGKLVAHITYHCSCNNIRITKLS